MTKKLTAYQREEREVRKIVQMIRKFEKKHPKNILERACVRYKMLNTKKRLTESRIKKLQEELDEAKNKLRK